MPEVVGSFSEALENIAFMVADYGLTRYITFRILVFPRVLHRWEAADVFDCRDVRASGILVLRGFVGCNASPGDKEGG
jgi:hypothetical protein